MEEQTYKPTEVEMTTKAISTDAEDDLPPGLERVTDGRTDLPTELKSPSSETDKLLREKIQVHHYPYNHTSSISPLVDETPSPGKVVEHFVLPTSFQMLKTAPLQVIFKDLEFRVQVQKKKEAEKSVGCLERLFGKAQTQENRILHGLNGVFTPGRLTAIMGASGSGKTSLLNLVSGQVNAPNGTITGKVIINGQSIELKDKRLKKVCGYVQQDDVILATMTVREAITMAALLRLPRAMSHEAKLARVQQVIELLHLEKCSENVIGSSLIKGISGGERKRVAIAMVMITNPAILYLDEPTSGLDAFTAYSICDTLKNVARTGRTVAATVHQPNSDIFHLFDDLVLLSEGKIIYHGPTESMVPFFAKQGYVCPQYTNPADYLFMSILNDAKKMVADGEKKGPTSEEQAAKLALLAEYWIKSTEQVKYVDDTVNSPTQGGVKTSDVLERASFQTQFKLLAQRAFKNAWRNKLMVKGRFGQTIFLGVLMGLIFLQLGHDQRGIQDREGSLFFVAVNGLMTSTMGVLSIFAAEKAVFVREYESGLYRLPAYFLSRTVVELPFKIVFPIIGGSLLYWIIGYQDVATKYLTMVLTMIILENCGTALGIFVASFFEDIAIALAIVPMLLMPLMVFSGFFVNSATSPEFLNWIKYISPMKYAFVALIKNEFTDLELYCTNTQLTPFRVNGTIQNYCHFTNGEQVVSLLGFDDEGSIAVNIIILACMYFVLLCLAYGALWRQLRLRK